LPNINRTQAAFIVTCHSPAATQWCRLLLRAAYGLQRTPHLTMHCQWGSLSSFSFFVSGDLDLWPWHSNSSERGSKHVFQVNLAQIRLAVPEIFHSYTNKEKSHRQR